MIEHTYQYQLSKDWDGQVASRRLLLLELFHDRSRDLGDLGILVLDEALNDGDAPSVAVLAEPLQHLPQRIGRRLRPLLEDLDEDGRDRRVVDLERALQRDLTLLGGACELGWPVNPIHYVGLW